MSKIDDACREGVGNVEGALACAVIDLETGRLLGIHTPGYGPVFNQTVAAATMELLRGSRMNSQEVHVMSRNNYHFARTLKGGKAAVILVTQRATSVGLGSAQMKAVLPKVESHLS
jgi:hypothetical protein